jgi:hypothetical protein
LVSFAFRVRERGRVGESEEEVVASVREREDVPSLETASRRWPGGAPSAARQLPACPR